MRIPEETIQDVRERINLVELISERTSLRQRGRNYVGLCPFHAENTPSFTVNEEKGFFHCFGCGASGNAFAWVMRTDNLTFPEAVRLLAARAGVQLPEAYRDRGERRGDDILYRVNEAAAKYYQRALGHETIGAPARSYLAERGIDAPLAQRFSVGFVPASGDGFTKWIRSKGVPIEAALSVGVIGRRRDGTVGDRFRGRLMFPIRDSRGRVSGFGGRVLPGAASDQPKYLNSPESAVFKKRQLLYGLPEAREAMRRTDRAILVEGYLDVLALHQQQVECAVAPLGTAVTADQLRYLRRYAGDVVACFDGDDAGIRAAARSFGAFVEAGLWGRAALLPPGEDPDTYVRQNGAPAFERVVAEAGPLLDVYLRTLMPAGERSIARRVQAAREIGRLLRRVRNPWEYDVLARRAAERLGVGEELLREEGRPQQPQAKPIAPGSRPRATGEAMLIELMLTGTDAVERVAREGGASLFEDSRWRELGEAILGRTESDDDKTELVERLPPEMRERVAATLLGERSEETNRQRLLDDCLGFIRKRQGRRRVREVLEEIRAAEAAGDDIRMQERLQEWRSLVASGDAGDPSGSQ
jgi:DNA primase